MNRSLLFISVLLLVAQAKLVAQEAAAAGQSAASAPAPLAPQPDNSTPATASASVPTTTTTSTTSTTSTTVTTPAPDTAKVNSTSTAMSREEIARVQQQEIIRRQELVFRANQALDLATKAELGTNYPEARKNYLFAVEAYGSISRSTTSYSKSAEGLTRVDFQLYDDALKIGDTARAKLLIDEVVKYNPNNKVANAKELEITRMLANPNDTSLLGNPAVTPELVKKVTEIQKLFAEAEQFRRTGQWDQAEARLKRILGIDPYNIAATKQLERIDSEKYDYAEHARVETRDERLRQVEEKWYEPINNKDSNTTAQETQPVITRVTTFDVDQKLKGIFLSLDFTNATIEEATNYLSIQSKQLDPTHKGISFIIQPAASSSAKPITLTLNNVPLDEALRYVCQLANVKYKIQDYAISIVPFNQSTEDLVSRTFFVQPSFVVPPTAGGVVTDAAAAAFGGRPLAPAAGAATPAATDDGNTDPLRKALEAKGVKFPPGATAVYFANTGQLSVVNTADQMELIEELVNAGQDTAYMVRISTKFVEINQNDLNDLTINSAFNFWNPLTLAGVGGTVTNNPLTTSKFSTSLPGSQAFAANGIDTLLAPQSSSFNSIFLRSFLDGSQFNIVLQALAQKKSFDLLSEPFALTKSGEQGVLEAVRVFPYPIAFDPPELLTVQTNNNNNNNTVLIAVAPPTVIATTPTDFQRKNIGIRLVVKPLVTADKRTVDLSLFPEVTDFQGFINYGSKIFVGNPDGSHSLLSNNTIDQPVFNTRRITTNVSIRDGATVVLGGLIREDMQTVNDKVPFLGDLPLIGRLFQSKAVTNTKRNLIIFVTANIYRNDGELLNPPEESNAVDVLTGHASFAPVSVTQ